LEYVFEDITTLGRVPQHLMVQAIIEVANLLRMSSFRKLQSVALVE